MWEKIINLIAINLVQWQINLQLILDFNLKNFTGKTTLMIVTADIAVIHMPLLTLYVQYT